MPFDLVLQWTSLCLLLGVDIALIAIPFHTGAQFSLPHSYLLSATRLPGMTIVATS